MLQAMVCLVCAIQGSSVSGFMPAAAVERAPVAAEVAASEAAGEAPQSASLTPSPGAGALMAAACGVGLTRRRSKR